MFISIKPVPFCCFHENEPSSFDAMRLQYLNLSSTGLLDCRFNGNSLKPLSCSWTGTPNRGPARTRVTSKYFVEPRSTTLRASDVQIAVVQRGSGNRYMDNHVRLRRDLMFLRCLVEKAV